MKSLWEPSLRKQTTDLLPEKKKKKKERVTKEILKTSDDITHSNLIFESKLKTLTEYENFESTK